MNRIALICMILTVGCAEEQEPDRKDSEWAVLWELENEQIQGHLVLFKDHHARLQVHGEQTSLLLNQPENVNFLWDRTDQEFTLKRVDNSIELEYNILKESHDFLELSYAGDVIVKLHRR